MSTPIQHSYRAVAYEVAIQDYRGNLGSGHPLLDESMNLVANEILNALRSMQGAKLVCRGPVYWEPRLNGNGGVELYIRVEGEVGAEADVNLVAEKLLHYTGSMLQVHVIEVPVGETMAGEAYDGHFAFRELPTLTCNGEPLPGFVDGWDRLNVRRGTLQA